jgi:hypothetical protein
VTLLEIWFYSKMVTFKKQSFNAGKQFGNAFFAKWRFIIFDTLIWIKFERTISWHLKRKHAFLDIERLKYFFQNKLTLFGNAKFFIQRESVVVIKIIWIMIVTNSKFDFKGFLPNSYQSRHFLWHSCLLIEWLFHRFSQLKKVSK